MRYIKHSNRLIYLITAASMLPSLLYLKVTNSLKSKETATRPAIEIHTEVKNFYLALFIVMLVIVMLVIGTDLDPETLFRALYKVLIENFFSTEEALEEVNALREFDALIKAELDGKEVGEELAKIAKNDKPTPSTPC